MNTQERINTLYLMFKAFGQEPDREMAKMYLETLSSLTDEQFRTAANKLMTTAHRMPVPAMFFDALGRPSEKEAATEAVMKINRAVTKFGWPNADEAKAWLGEDLWNVVESCGGWSRVCKDDLVNPSQIASFSRVRELVQFQLPQLTMPDRTMIEGNNNLQIEDSKKKDKGESWQHFLTYKKKFRSLNRFWLKMTAS